MFKQIFEIAAGIRLAKVFDPPDQQQDQQEAMSKVYDAAQQVGHEAEKFAADYEKNKWRFFVSVLEQMVKNYLNDAKNGDRSSGLDITHAQAEALLQDFQRYINRLQVTWVTKQESET